LTIQGPAPDHANSARIAAAKATAFKSWIALGRAAQWPPPGGSRWKGLRFQGGTNRCRARPETCDGRILPKGDAGPL